MIHNYSARPTIFDSLHKLSETLYPTGSRFFGCDTLRSDYDYFAQDSYTLSRELIRLGFREHASQSNYDDTNTNRVYRYYDPTSKTQIDVQLVYDVKKKIQIQNKFKESGILKPTTQEWNIAYLFYSEQKENRFKNTPDVHCFSDKIHIIKHLREKTAVRNQETGEFSSPLGLKEWKDIVESIMALALKG